LTRLVLLHGFLGGPDSWDRVRLLLAASGAGPGDRPACHEIVAPWLPGHGPDAEVVTQAGRPRSERFDAAVEAFADQIGGPPSLWVGYSMGARIALGIAARRPALVRGLVLVSSHLGLSLPEDRARRAEEDEAFARLAADGGCAGMEALARAHESRAVLVAQRSLAPEVVALLHARRRAHEPRAIASSIRAMGLGVMPDLRAALAGLHIPVEIVAGGDDATYGALAREAADLTDGAAVIAAGVGHDVVLESPEHVARALARVLARIEDGTRIGDGTRQPSRVTESHP